MKKNIQLVVLLFMLISSVLFAIHKQNNNTVYTIKKATQLQQDADFTQGEGLFVYNCKGCHLEGMMRKSTAPPLGGITKRRNKKWLYAYTKNSQRMFVEGDSIAIALRNQNWGLMTAFPELSDADLDKVYYYVEKRYQMSLDGIPVPIRFAFNRSEKAKACKHIFVEKKDILRVSVSKNRDWKFSCGNEKHIESDWQKTTLEKLFEYDKSINEIATILYNFPVFRKSKDSGWDFE